jgi:hypothetical protein
MKYFIIAGILILLVSCSGASSKKHTFTVHSNYTFNDHITFKNRNGTGSGPIVAITFDASGTVDYLIMLDDSQDEVIGGIYEEHIIP